MSIATKHPGLVEWLLFGEVGTSSKAIVTHLTAGRVAPGFNDPADVGDFRRCEKLLRSVPTLRAELPRMASVSPVWAGLVHHWEEIATLLEEEVPGIYESVRWPHKARAPQAGALIRRVHHEAGA